MQWLLEIYCRLKLAFTSFRYRLAKVHEIIIIGYMPYVGFQLEVLEKDLFMLGFYLIPHISVFIVIDYIAFESHP